MLETESPDPGPGPGLGLSATAPGRVEGRCFSCRAPSSGNRLYPLGIELLGLLGLLCFMRPCIGVGLVQPGYRMGAGEEEGNMVV